ncbi:MAG: DUF433 domain-containing protein [Verrucomicrobiales bacterium]|nr:DUF433 domain-containing protein [Verrucomicrobiales bacterium]
MKNALLKRIEVNPRVMIGKPVIRGTRIPVEIILEKLAADLSIEEILEDYPRLTRQDVLAAFAYARGVVGTEEIVPQVRLSR